MPNPIAHPAAAVPFTRAGLVLSALVIGSISPDLIYLFPSASPDLMYTVPGLLLFDVPAGFILLWLFHTFVKWPLLSLAPDSLQRRLIKPAEGFSFGPRRRFGLILLSVLVGSLTHVVWDSFTHDWGWFVKNFAILRSSPGGMPVYTVLQALGTVLGVCLLAYWSFQWLPRAPQSELPSARFSVRVRMLFLVLTVVSLAVVDGAAMYAGLGPGAELVQIHGLMHGLILAAVLVMLFYGVAYALAWTIAFRKTVRPVR